MIRRPITFLGFGWVWTPGDPESTRLQDEYSRVYGLRYEPHELMDEFAHLFGLYPFFGEKVIGVMDPRRTYFHTKKGRWFQPPFTEEMTFKTSMDYIHEFGVDSEPRWHQDHDRNVLLT